MNAWCTRRFGSALVGVAFTVIFAGCALFTRDRAPTTILNIAKITCLVNKLFEVSDDKLLLKACDIVGEKETEEALKVISAQRAGMIKASLQGAPDGGR